MNKAQQNITNTLSDEHYGSLKFPTNDYLGLSKYSLFTLIAPFHEQYKLSQIKLTNSHNWKLAKLLFTRN